MPELQNAACVSLMRAERGQHGVSSAAHAAIEVVGKSNGSMPPTPLPALPPDVWRCIMQMALTAEGSMVQARVRLSLVCRTWRDCLRSAHCALLCCPPEQV